MSQLETEPSPTHTPVVERERLAGTLVRIRIVGWTLALILGSVQALRGRHAMNPDGVSYLDIADAYLSSAWSTAINAYWSPLYSWVIGAAMAVTRPSAFSEASMVHVVNFGLYVLSLAAFEFLLTELIRARRRLFPPDVDVEQAWRILGYSLFVWSSIMLISLTTVAPDLCVAALVYLASGILLRLGGPHSSRWLPVGLGVAVGLGYLAKAAMFPLGFVFIVVSAIGVRPRRLAVQRAALGLAGFLIVASPYVVALSISEGHPTWGAVGKMAYAWCVEEAPLSPPCGAESADTRSVVHATRRISDSPAVYEFATPVAGSFPPWYDPAHWYRHLSVHLLPARSTARLVVHSLEYLRLLAPVVSVFLALLWLNGRSSVTETSVRTFMPLILPACVALLMYGVVYIQPRYIGPFLVLLSLGAFATLRPTHLRPGPSLFRGASLAIAAVLITPVVVSLLLNAVALATRPELTGRSAHVQWEIAQALAAAGLRPGDAVAQMGGHLAPYWARLAGLRVAAEVSVRDDAGNFWASDARARARVEQLMANAGIKGIVATSIPPLAPRDGWRSLDVSGYQLFLVSP